MVDTNDLKGDPDIKREKGDPRDTEEIGLKGDEIEETAPIGTFDRLPFDLMLSQYDYSKNTNKTCELGQALLMTANLKQTAS